MWDSERRAASEKRRLRERLEGWLGELSTDGVGGCGKESALVNEVVFDE